MAALAERSQPIDLVTLKDELVAGLGPGGGGRRRLPGRLRRRRAPHHERRALEPDHQGEGGPPEPDPRQQPHRAGLPTRRRTRPALILDRAEKAIFDIAEHRIRQGFVGIREIVKESFRTIDQLSQSQGAGHRPAHRLRRPRREDERPAEGRPHHRGRAAGDGEDVVLPQHRAVRVHQDRGDGRHLLAGDGQGAARPAHALRGRAGGLAPAAHGQPAGEGLGAPGQGLRRPVRVARSSSTTPPRSPRWRCARSAAA